MIPTKQITGNVTKSCIYSLSWSGEVLIQSHHSLGGAKDISDGNTLKLPCDMII